MTAFLGAALAAVLAFSLALTPPARTTDHCTPSVIAYMNDLRHQVAAWEADWVDAPEIDAYTTAKRDLYLMENHGPCRLAADWPRPFRSSGGLK